MTFSLREMVLFVIFCGAVLGWCCAIYRTDQIVATKEFEFKELLAAEKQKHKDYVTDQETKKTGYYVLTLNSWHIMNPDGSISFFVQDSTRHSNVRVELCQQKPDKIVNGSQLGVDKFYPQLELEKQKEEVKNEEEYAEQHR